MSGLGMERRLREEWSRGGDEETWKPYWMMEEEEELEVWVKVETAAGIYYTAHRLLMDNAKSRMATKAVEVFDFFDFQIMIRGGGL